MTLDQNSKSRLAWRLVLLIVAQVMLAALFVLPGWFGGDALARWRGVLAAFLLIGSWFCAIRFLLLATWGRWFWLALLGISVVFPLTLGGPGVWAGLFFTASFLAFREYYPWRFIPSRRRALGFGLGVVTVSLLFVAGKFWPLLAEDESLELIRNLGGWAFGSVIIFWLWSLFHLAVRMRLHFLRLRPKLLISALLIGFLPLVLLAALGSLTTYFSLGAARATRADHMLQAWVDMADSDVEMTSVGFDSTFVWSAEPQALPQRQVPDEATVVAAPDWVDEMAARLTEITDPKNDTTGWFLAGQEVWLVRWRGLRTPQPTAVAWHLGQGPLQDLSRALTAGIDLSPADADEPSGIVDLDLGAVPAENFSRRRAIYRDISDDPDFWDRFFYFGATTLHVTRLGEDRVESEDLLLNLRVRWPDLIGELADSDNDMNLIVLVSLILLVVGFIVIEIFSIFFSIRITEGIIAGVHTLHRGTRVLADGNLDTVIEIPNEDEFGDLADSFNQMTVALKKSHEDALAHEALIREMETARAIQDRLLPHQEPRLKGFEITGASIPSREIGGDYFDFIIQPDDTVGVAIGDVSGKGMPAALLMSNLQASLHGQVIHPSSVAETVSRVNDLIVGSTDPHMFATFFYGVVDLNNGAFTSTNAGHNPPMLLRASGDVELLTSGGVLLGMLADQVYSEDTVNLGPGDVILLYTDGISEAVGPSADEDDVDAMFGTEALEEVLRRSSHLPAVGIKEAILDAVAEHTAGEAQSDDITLVVVRRQG